MELFEGSKRGQFWLYNNTPALLPYHSMKEENLPGDAKEAWYRLKAHEDTLWQALCEWQDSSVETMFLIEEQTDELGESPEGDHRVSAAIAAGKAEEVQVLLEEWLQHWVALLAPPPLDALDPLEVATKAALIVESDRGYYYAWNRVGFELNVLDEVDELLWAVQEALYRWDTARMYAERFFVEGHQESAAVYAAIARSKVSAIQSILRAWTDGWKQRIVTLTHDDIAALGQMLWSWRRDYHAFW